MMTREIGKPTCLYLAHLFENLEEMHSQFKDLITVGFYMLSIMQQIY